VARVDVRHQALADIHAGAVAPDGLTGAGVVNAHARRLETNRVSFVFADEKQLEAGSVGVEITEV
jgi:hypothetical protein